MWDTAINAIALVESGVEPDHPALRKASTWLYSKEVRMRGDWIKQNPYHEASGWAFEFNNVYYPDTDDTAMVLMALRFIQPEDPQAARRGVQARAGLADELPMQRRWLGGVRQGRDERLAGGHPVRRPQRDARPVVLRPDGPHARTARLPRLGQARPPGGARAISHLKRTQCDDGSWYGRWGVNYIYGTWQVLRGTACDRLRHERELGPARGRDWLSSCQNDDGGLGRKLQHLRRSRR